jgi:hypothetical protein
MAITWGILHLLPIYILVRILAYFRFTPEAKHKTKLQLVHDNLRLLLIVQAARKRKGFIHKKGPMVSARLNIHLNDLLIYISEQYSLPIKMIINRLLGKHLDGKTAFISTLLGKRTNYGTIILKRL